MEYTSIELEEWKYCDKQKRYKEFKDELHSETQARWKDNLVSEDDIKMRHHLQQIYE